MTSRKKYVVVFLMEFLLFAGILCLFDWNTLDSQRVYGNLFQGVLFGVFMTAYHYWEDKRVKNKDKSE